MEAEREMSKQTNKDKLRLEKVNADNFYPIGSLKVGRDQQKTQIPEIKFPEEEMSKK